MASTLTIGDPAPWFVAASTSNPRYNFETAAGRYLLLFFFGSAARPDSARVLSGLQNLTALFDDTNFALFGVSNDPADLAQQRVAQRIPGYRYFWDFDGRVAALFGVAAAEAAVAAPLLVEPALFLLSPSLQVMGIERLDEPEAFLARITQRLRALPPIGAEPTAPVLLIPDVLERALCRELIGLYERHGGKDSGYMTQVNGKTVGVIDYGKKRRSDYTIEDEAIQARINLAVHRRLVPMILRAFQFRATRIERYIVACYDAGQGGYFRPHRDNTTLGTAHRRFAVTINLNAEDHEGGELCFPEFGQRTYRASTGGAVVFSCSLLHEAKPVTRGRRYATLPFLYDDAAAKIRETNRHYIVPDESQAAGPAPTTDG
jgi:peroxiredoxin/predicted 2-oxoglutarate/Fe(II)-dependent dioxygenase YbiX